MWHEASRNRGDRVEKARKEEVPAMAGDGPALWFLGARETPTEAPEERRSRSHQRVPSRFPVFSPLMTVTHFQYYCILEERVTFV